MRRHASVLFADQSFSLMHLLYICLGSTEAVHVGSASGQTSGETILHPI